MNNLDSSKPWKDYNLLDVNDDFTTLPLLSTFPSS